MSARSDFQSAASYAGAAHASAGRLRSSANYCLWKVIQGIISPAKGFDHSLGVHFSASLGTHIGKRVDDSVIRGTPAEGDQNISGKGRQITQKVD